MSQKKELAESINVTRQTISLIEVGKYNPTINLCIAFVKFLIQT
ncbi:helix-turn-helix domain-containing protein [Staphylococcus agnetis]|nr:helix-turn-helix domain-containing protein [Staphylococcus agnetis]MCO4351513.1 helix-turn-helix domain-containing protein [Staphylococcus agnetis]